MKKLIYFSLIVIVAGLVFSSCKKKKDEEDAYTIWEKYADWRETNTSWLLEQETYIDPMTGTLFYEKLVAPWDPAHYVLVHWFNERDDNPELLTPLYNSTITTCYILRLYDGTVVDSSYSKKNAEYTAALNTLVEGWQIALSNMHVGDTVQMILPYNVGYGNKNSGSIKPYSTLQFNLKLRDIPCYEIKP